MAAVQMLLNSKWLDSFNCFYNPHYNGSHAARCARPAASRSDNGGVIGARHAIYQVQCAVRATAVALSDADVLPTADPALDTLIDGWLSNRQNSTSGPESSSSYRKGSSNRSNGGSAGSDSISVQSALWDAVLGPVSVTLDSLSTLEDGDEMFVLSDSLCHLAGTLQELQALATQLQQQQDTAADYSGQLAALLSTSAKQVDSLTDAVLLNLLAIAAVLLTAQTSYRDGSSSARSKVQTAAAAAVRVALAELWQRPAAAAVLNPAQLTSLSVVLHRLSKMGLDRQIPSTLLASAFEQLQEQAVPAEPAEWAVQPRQAVQAVQQSASLAPSQLAVCFWCLSNSRVAPPAAAVIAVLDAAAAALSAGQMDSTAVLRMNAALQNLRMFLLAGASTHQDMQPTGLGSLSPPAPAAAAMKGTGKVGRLQKALAGYVAAAAQYATVLVNSSSGSTSNNSTKSAVTAGKVVVSVAQLCSTYRCHHCTDVQQQQQQLLQAVVDNLFLHQPTTGSSFSRVELVTAAGFLLRHWQHVLSEEQQQHAVQAVFSNSEQQQQQQQQGPDWDTVRLFLDAAVHCPALPQECFPVLDIAAQQVLQHAANALQPSQQQQQLLQCHSLLLRLVAGNRHATQHLIGLTAAVAAAAAPEATPAVVQAEAAADAAVALCVLRVQGWQQQLQQLQEQALSSYSLALVPVRSLLRVAATATAAAPAAPVARKLATAAVQQLLHDHSLSGAPTSQAVEVLVLLTGVLREQQQQQRLEAAAEAATAVDANAVLQQCMHCMLLLQQHARGILPGQIVPLLSALLQLQQWHQQQQQLQWQLSTEQPPPAQVEASAAVSFAQLHQETLAAAALQLEDSARYLSTRHLSASVRLLALLQYRPTLALAAVASAAAGRTDQFAVSQLVWLLWGFTKLRFTHERGFTRMLKIAIERTVLPAAADVPSAVPHQHQQEQQQQGSASDAAFNSQDGSSNSNAATSPVTSTAAAAAAPLHQIVALIWIAASRGYQSPDLTLLLEQVLTHPESPSIAQLSSVAWSFAHLCSYSKDQQLQQQRQRVLDWVDGGCSSSSSSDSSSMEDVAECMPIKSVVNIAWSFNKLGHVPSMGAQAALLVATLEQQQQQQQQQQMTPAELSCFVYCLSSWGSTPLIQQRLQHLEQQLLQGTHTDQQQQQRMVAPGSSDHIVGGWDGPALCSCCWGLVNLGHALQRETLQAVEQRLQQLMPAVPTTPTATSPSSSSSSSNVVGRPKQHLVAPSAQDLAMFAEACRQSGYQPTQLLSQFRSWLLLQLAKQGSAALLRLSSVKSPANRAAAAAAQSRTAAAALSTSSTDQLQQQQGPAAVASQHANVLVCVLMMLRQLNCADAAMLHQLEAVAASYPTSQQLTGQQLVMVLKSFQQLQHFPGTWWVSGLRKQIRSRISQLSARDCIELLDVISAWRQQPGVGSSTAMRQYILPMLTQRLLGQIWAPKSAAAAAVGGSSSSSSRSNTASPVASAAGSSSDSDSEQQQPANCSSSGDGEVTAPEHQQVPAAAAAAAAMAYRSTNMMAQLSGPQAASLLCSCSQLGIKDKQLQRQALRQVEQQWSTLDAGAQLAAVHAAVRLQYDATSLLNASTLLPQPQKQQQAGSAGSTTFSPIGSTSAAARALWIFGNVGKHPGQALLDAALTTVAAAAAASSSAAAANAAVSSPDHHQQQQYHLLPLREMSNALYAAAVLHELPHPAAVALAQQLQAAAAAGQLLHHPQFMQHAPQLAACLLAAQVAAPTAAGAPPAANTAPGSGNKPNPQPGFSTGTGSQNPGQAAQQVPSQKSSPWLGLSRDVQQRLLEGWRRRTILRSQQKPHWLQQEVVQCLKQLGIRCKANALTPDACVCIDVAATSPQGEVLAIELLGPHNAASNTQRPLGPARLKWRWLAARGYRVIIINGWQWQNLEGPTRSRDDVSGARGGKSSGAEIFSEKLLFLQARLAGPIAAAVTAATAAEGSQLGWNGSGKLPAVTQQTVDGIGNGTSSSTTGTGEQGSLRGKLWAAARRPVRPQQQQ